MSDELKRARKVRGGHRATLTTKTKNIDQDLIHKSEAELVGLKGAIVSRLGAIKTLDEQIFALIDDQETLEHEMSEAFTFLTCHETIVYRCEAELINRSQPQTNNGPRPASVVKLPTIALPMFDGKPTAWVGFWDAFSSAIHQRTDLTDVQRLTYLRGQLSGEAKTLLEGFSMTSDNYKPSWELLKATYGQPNKIKAAHIVDLLNLQKPKCTIPDLKAFRAAYECHLRSLDAQDLTLNELLTVILYDKLPSPFKEVLKRSSKDEWLNLDKFRVVYQEELDNVELTSPNAVRHQEQPEPAASAIFSIETKSAGVKPKRTCKLCKDPQHPWSKCPKYSNPDARIGRARQLQLCTACLARQHEGACWVKDPCIHCGAGHLNLMCPTKRTKEMEQKESTQPSDTQIQSLKVSPGSETVILPTIQLPMSGDGGRSVCCRALLDQCSQRTFVTRPSLSQLSHKVVRREFLKLRGFTGASEPQSYDVVELRPSDRQKCRSIRAVVVDSLPERQILSGLQSSLHKLKELGYKLADPSVGSTDPNLRDLTLLIGADQYYQIVHPGYKRWKDIILLPTKYGYALSGQVKGQNSDPQVEVISALHVASTPIDHYLRENTGTILGGFTPYQDDLTRLWNLDHIGIASGELDQESKEVLAEFESSIRYSADDEQYVVRLPWRNNRDQLPTNFHLAKARMRGLQQKFTKDPQYGANYSNVIQDQEGRGFIERVTNAQTSETCHYLAHHGVFKVSKTTPIRIVFDCSARANKTALSLNDCLYTGPSLVADLAKVLLRLRVNPLACLSDIEKAFLMLRLDERDRDATRFLWPENPSDPDSPLITYRFTAVLFGATCSQFLLNATILKHLSDREGNTILANRCRRGLYVDNLQATGLTEDDLMSFYQSAQRLFASAHLGLREWVTNSQRLSAQLRSDGVASQDCSTVKTLGLEWNSTNDTLSSASHVTHEPECTKRGALSITAQLFDPLGALLPVSIRSRRFIQELWRRKLDWDNQIPEDLRETWQQLNHDLITCVNIDYPRQIATKGAVELHAFSDASNVAYGAAIYIVCDGKAHLAIAKAKVAPIKPLSVPKMELTAVLLAARLVQFTTNAYQEELEFSSIHLWCDSQITLYWLKSQKILPVYVRNRVDEITLLLPNITYHYIPTEDNPSDLITRGMSAKSLKKSTLWWTGPEWLPHPDHWPQWGNDPDPQVDQILVNEVQEGEEVVSSPVDPVRPSFTLIRWERFGSYQKLLRVVAWVKRYVNNRVDQFKQRDLNFTPNLSSHEIQLAENSVIKLVQQEGFQTETQRLSDNRSRPTNLTMQLGLYLEDEIIRCKGRIGKSSLDDTAKYPILLPNGHHVTGLIISDEHQHNHHYGVNNVVAALRQHWWIPKMRQATKKVLRRCIICKKLQGRAYPQQTPPPLPELRVNQVRPFQITGVDYTGALNVRGTNNHTEKVYIALFTCAVTRAIHLELATDQSCESFLRAFKRFCGRRSYPQILMSDNATTFVCAANYLEEMAKDPKVQDHLSSIRCEWRFIPARAPWFGAIWERAIGIVKMGVKKVLGRALLSADELLTVLVEIEASVNDRPITYVSGDVDEPEPLTPSHLVCGRRLRSFPQETLDHNDPTWRKETAITSRYKHLSKVNDDWWRRWSNEYLTSLRESHKCDTKVKAGHWPEPGDVVLIHDEGPRLFWRLGTIIEILDSIDTVPRVARLRTSTGLTTRPLVKLYPLELTIEHHDEPDDDQTSEETVNGSEVTPQCDSTSTGDRGPPAPFTAGTRSTALRATQMWQSCIASGQL